MYDRIKWLSLAPLIFTTVLYAQPLQKTFGSWQITCNNLNRCEARSFPSSDGLAMTIVRQAGQDDDPLLRIDYGSGYSGELSGGALQDNLLLDGQRLRLDLKHWHTTPHHLISDHRISVNEFLAQIIDADRLQLLYRDDAVIPLKGLKAALLLMDSVQGRVNSASAWARRGPRPGWEVPAAPGIPQVYQPERPPLPLTPEETRELIDFGSQHINSESCSLDRLRRQVSVSPLTDDKALLLVGCEMGAYNVIDLAFEVTRQPPYIPQHITLMLPFVPPDRSDRQLDLINADYDAESGQLLTFSKMRGLGDCGVATRWQYNGREFVLAEYAQESICDAWNSSDRWPALWITQQRRPSN
ncbi:DUF1176 domain-containing protein [Erwiniaceae bacterium CAU 1747]